MQASSSATVIIGNFSETDDRIQPKLLSQFLPLKILGLEEKTLNNMNIFKPRLTKTKAYYLVIQNN